MASLALDEATVGSAPGAQTDQQEPDQQDIARATDQKAAPSLPGQKSPPWDTPDLDVPADQTSGRMRTRKAGLPLAGPAVHALRNLGYSSVFYSLRLGGAFPQKLKASPNDIWPGDEARGHQMLAGCMSYNGMSFSGAGPDFNDAGAPEELLAWAHSFAWLRDLAATNQRQRARAIAEPALRAWLTDYSNWHKLAWRPDIIGTRLMAIINHAPLVLANNDLVYRSQVLNTMAKQGRHLVRTLGLAKPGLPRLQAATGLVFSSLLLPGGDARVTKGIRALEAESKTFLQPDGFPESRSSVDLSAYIKLMVTLRDGYRAARTSPPVFLQEHVDRAVAAMKALSIEGVGMAAFNGAQHGMPGHLRHLLDMSEAKVKPVENGRYGGYQRLNGGSTAVVLDCGLPPVGGLSQQAHASQMAIELFDGETPVIINCGHEAAGLPGDALRATAAHSSAVINDTNAAQIRADGRIGRSAKSIEVGRRSGAEGTIVAAKSHAYAKRYRIEHERRIWLSSDGGIFAGEDIFSTTHGRAPRAKHKREAVLRFHLAPAISVNLTGREGDVTSGAILQLKGGSWWKLDVCGAALSCEQSLQALVGAARAVPTKQLLLSINLDAAHTSVHWRFSRAPA